MQNNSFKPNMSQREALNDKVETFNSPHLVLNRIPPKTFGVPGQAPMTTPGWHHLCQENI